MPGGVHTLQLALQQVVPFAQVALPHAMDPSEMQTAAPSNTSHVVPVGQSVTAQGFVSGTHAQTVGESSQTMPPMHFPSALHSHRPPQSAPPFFGSQSSDGSSTHMPAPGPEERRIRAQNGASGTQLAVPPSASQCVPARQRTAAHGSCVGSGTHPHTLGESSQTRPLLHSPSTLHSHRPLQSAPPFCGSQSSEGSSTHMPEP